MVEYLGHSSFETTKGYIETSVKDQNKALAKAKKVNTATPAEMTGDDDIDASVDSINHLVEMGKMSPEMGERLIVQVLGLKNNRTPQLILSSTISP